MTTQDDAAERAAEEYAKKLYPLGSLGNIHHVRTRINAFLDGVAWCREIEVAKMQTELDETNYEAGHTIFELKEEIAKLQAENAKLRAENWVLKDERLRTYDGMTERYEIMREALEYYANRTNWEEINGTDQRIVSSGTDILCDVDINWSSEPFNCGGKIARECLQKVSGK